MASGRVSGVGKGVVVRWGESLEGSDFQMINTDCLKVKVEDQVQNQVYNPLRIHVKLQVDYQVWDRLFWEMRWKVFK